MNIIFDLDGTLIDSSDGILNAIEMAFKVCNVELKQPLTAKLIGPPLTKLLPMLTGSNDATLIASLSSAFKERYDFEGYKKTTIFDGVEALFSALSQQHFMCIATNKRIIPTRKIVEHFGWQQWFDHVYALDSFDGLENKSELIAKVMALHQMKREDTLYIGDTVADKDASLLNNIHYLMALWGYDSEGYEDGFSVHEPMAVLTHIKSIQT
jgi:phosphoglycolate phosphatase